MSSNAPRQLRASEPAGPLHAPAADVDTGLAQSAGNALPAWSDSPRQLKQGAQMAQLQAAETSATPAQGGLPQGLRQGIESLSGLDLSGVRVHRNSSKPAALQAHAYAQGQDIHLGPGQEKHLPHEAWHVVQQAQGRVRPTRQLKRQGVSVNDDLSLERESDLMGYKAAEQGLRGQQPAALPTPRPPGSLAVPRPRQDPVAQRYLIVGNTDYTRWYKETAASTTDPDRDSKIAASLDLKITEIAGQMLGSLSLGDAEEKRVSDAIVADAGGLLRSQIGKWIKDDKGSKSSSKSHPTFGAKAQTRAYAGYKDLSLALLGWIEAKPMRRWEKSAASFVEHSDAISYHLDTVLHNIQLKINSHSTKGAEISNDIKTRPAGLSGKRWDTYKAYFDAAGKGGSTTLPDNFDDVLANPQNYDVRQKTGVLHDLMQYFYDKKTLEPSVDFLEENPSTKASEEGGSGTVRVHYNRPANSHIKPSQMDAGLVKPEHIPGAVGGVNPVGISTEESHPSYKFARKHKLPMFARHSYTAARMISLAERAGSSKEQMEAVAWATHSYWRQHYDHTSIPYHTMHEIMDFLPDFGISYDPLAPEAGLKKFEDGGFTTSLERSILATPVRRDIDKYTAKVGNDKACLFLLTHPATWSHSDAMGFIVSKVDARCINECRKTLGDRATADTLLSDGRFLANAQILHFLSTTFLPDTDFYALPAKKLKDFFMANPNLYLIYSKIAPERQSYVMTGKKPAASSESVHRDVVIDMV